jgi:pyruvate kinase
MQAREYLSKLGDLYQTQIFAKIENIEVFSIYLYLITQLILYWPKPNVMLVLCTYLNLSFFQGLTHFDEILQEADGIILSRGNLGIDLPPEKVSSKFNEAVFLHIA